MHAGRISVLNTISTMEVGETWTTNMDEVQLPYAQVCCSRYGFFNDKRFTVSAPRSMKGSITIKRVK